MNRILESIVIIDFNIGYILLILSTKATTADHYHYIMAQIVILISKYCKNKFQNGQSIHAEESIPLKELIHQKINSFDKRNQFLPLPSKYSKEWNCKPLGIGMGPPLTCMQTNAECTINIVKIVQQLVH